VEVMEHKPMVEAMEYYTIDAFRQGEYKDWSTHGTWYSPKLKVINCFIIWH
jgi:hypothetical protein